MKALAVILLVVILSIAIPTRDKWSYKVMYDRKTNEDTEYCWDAKPLNQKTTPRNKK